MVREEWQREAEAAVQGPLEQTAPILRTGKKLLLNTQLGNCFLFRLSITQIKNRVATFSFLSEVYFFIKNKIYLKEQKKRGI